MLMAVFARCSLRRALRVGLLLVLSGALACATKTNVVSPAPTDEEVSGFLAEYEAAISAHDWRSFRSLFLPEATITFVEHGSPHRRRYRAAQWIEELAGTVEFLGYTRVRGEPVILERGPGENGVTVESLLVESALVPGDIKEIARNEVMVLVKEDGDVRIAALGYELADARHVPTGGGRP